MTEVPNVSFVMRELTGLSSQVDSLLRHTDSKIGPTDPRSIRQQIQTFEKIGGGSRQERHRQLMERMKESVGQTKSLLYGSALPEEKYTPSYQPSRTYQAPSEFSTKFVMPKINYRHLGNATHQPSETQSVLRNTNSSLQREFYDADAKRQHGTQYHDDERPEPSNTATKLSRTGKPAHEEDQPSYEDVLQRYYDICTRRRRKVVASQIEEPKTAAEGPSRFTRIREPSNEAGIDRAMRILLDRR